MHPETFYHFRLTDEVKRTPLAVLYRAFDLQNSQEVMLKVLSPGCLYDPTIRARLQNEFNLVSFIETRAILKPLEFGEYEGSLFYSAPFLNGGSLEDRLKQGHLLLPEAAAVVHRLASDLDALHATGVVHGNIKPSNILFDDQGQPFLSDFGMAKVAASAASLEPNGCLIGPPAYLSPEHCRGLEALSPSSDLYMLGALLFEMLTGEPPFTANSALGFAVSHLALSPPRISSINNQLPSWLDRFFLSALAKEPEKRFQSAGEMAHALARAGSKAAWKPVGAPALAAKPAESAKKRFEPTLVVTDPPVLVAAAENLSESKKPKVRLRLLTTLAVLAVLLLAAASGFLVYQSGWNPLPGLLPQSGPTEVALSSLPESMPTIIQQEVQPSLSPTASPPAAVSPTKPAPSAAQAVENTATAEPTASPATGAMEASPTPLPTDALPASQQSQPAAPIPSNYTVQYNDTLFLIASRFGVDLTETMGLNSFTCSSPLPVGTQIVLPPRPAVSSLSLQRPIDETSIKQLILVHILECTRDARALAFSADERLLAVATGNFIYLWETGTWKPVARLKGHYSSINSLAFSPGGDTLASGSDDATVILWQISDGSQQKVLKGHTGPVTAVAYSPQGNLLVSTSRDSSVRVWSSDGSLLNRLSGYAAFSASFSPDGTRLAVGYADSVRLYNPEDMKLTLTLPAKDVVNMLSFSPDGMLISSSSELWHVEEARRLYYFESSTHQAAFTNDGQLVLVSNAVWDVSNGKLVSRLKNPLADTPRTKNEWDSLILSSSGTLMAWGSKDGVTLWKAGNASPTASSGTLYEARPGDNLYTIANEFDVSLKGLLDENRWSCSSPVFSTQHVLVPDQKSRLETYPLNHPSFSAENIDKLTQFYRPSDTCVKNIGKVFFSSNGKYLLSGSAIWNLATGSIVLQPAKIPVGTDGELNTQSPSQLMIFSPDGDLVAVRVEKNIELWDPANGRLVRVLSGHQGIVAAVAFSPDGSIVVSVSSTDEQIIRFWKVEDGSLLQSITGYTAQTLLFTPDGQTLIGQSDDTARFWQVETGKLLKSLQGIQGSPTLSPDGKLLAFISCEKKVRDACVSELASVYRIADGVVTFSMMGITEEIQSLRFSPDGSVLIAASDYGIVAWNTSNGSIKHRMIVPRNLDKIEQIYYSTDGALIFSVMYNHTLRIWDAETGELISIKAGLRADDLAFHPQNNLLAMLNNRQISLWVVKP